MNNDLCIKNSLHSKVYIYCIAEYIKFKADHPYKVKRFILRQNQN